MPDRLRASFRRHEPFLLVLLLFVAFRLAAIWLMRPGGFIADASDYDFYYEWGALGARGYRTFDNLWTAYPPLFPALMLPIFEAAARIPAWVEPRLWFHILFGSFLLLFETGNLILIYRLGRRLAREGTGDARPAPIEPALFYALLFVPVHTLLGWFEAMPLFFLLLGLDLLLAQWRGAWAASAVAAALGFLVKLTPIVLLPVAIRRLGARLSWRAARVEWFDARSAGNLLRPALYAAICLGVMLGVGYALVGGRTELALSSFRVNAIRPPWQSVWALIDGFYGFGLVPLDMRNVEGLQRTLWESRLPWGVISLAFAALYLWLYTRAYDWTRDRTAVAFTGASVILLLLYSKGWSPQFLVWVLAFLVLLMPTARGVVVALALSALNVLEAYVFLILLPGEHWIMVGTVLLRTVLLVALAVEFLAQIWPALQGRTQRAAAWAQWGLAAGVVLCALLGAPRMAQAYGERRLAEHPCREAIALLQAEAGGATRTLATNETALWRDLYPWLSAEYSIRVVDDYDANDRPADAVQADHLRALAGEEEFWWLQAAGDALVPAPFFDDPEVRVLEDRTLGACRLARVLRLPAGEPLAVAEVAGGPIELLAAEIGAPAASADALPVVLYWQARAPVEASYTVFTQLFDASGRMVAQQDNLPVGGLAPTDTWTPGALIRDAYRLPLAGGLAPGNYRLLVGLYTDAVRLPLRLADGTTADAISFDVATAAPTQE